MKIVLSYAFVLGNAKVWSPAKIDQAEAKG